MVRTRFSSSPDAVACIWRDRTSTYAQILEASRESEERLRAAGIGSGDTIAVIAEYSPTMIATLAAIIEMACVAVPLPPTLHSEERALKLELAHVQHVVEVADDDSWTLAAGPGDERLPLVNVLVERGHAGFVVFTSGTTGQPKAVLHDFAQFFRPIDTPRRKNATLAFFPPDHLAGLNTLFYTVFNGGCLVCVGDRSPETVCGAIERHHVQFLPTSPTFLQLVLLSNAHVQHDLSSLELVTFGSEPAHDHILERLREALPRTRFHQVYGVSELNNLRSQPREPGSRWLKLRPEGYETKVKNGTLWVKTTSAMLGYLNAPSPFDEDGWFDTGDLVETDGEFVRILGRRSEIISVGGDKVHPTEVENVVMALDNVKDATIFGQRHPIVGQVVAAKVALEHPEPVADFKRRLRRHCRERLPRYKVPVTVELVDRPDYTGRFKRARGAA